MRKKRRSRKYINISINEVRESVIKYWGKDEDTEGCVNFIINGECGCCDWCYKCTPCNEYFICKEWEDDDHIYEMVFINE